jgi:hypothetical protein
MTVHTAESSGFFRSIGDAWSRYRKRRAAVAELQALDRGELDRLVQDAGLTFSDLVELASQSSDSAALLHRRLEQAGISLRAMDKSVLRDMQRCCSFCDSKAQCEHDLAHQPKGAAWPEYCPNRLTIETLGASKCH